MYGTFFEGNNINFFILFESAILRACQNSTLASGFNKVELHGQEEHTQATLK